MSSVNFTYIILPIFLSTDFLIPLYKQNKSQNKVFMTKWFFLFVAGRQQKVFLAFVIISCLFLSFSYLWLLGRGKILDFYLVLFGSADKDCKFNSKTSCFWYSPRMVFDYFKCVYCKISSLLFTRLWGSRETWIALLVLQWELSVSLPLDKQFPWESDDEC